MKKIWYSLLLLSAHYLYGSIVLNGNQPSSLLQSKINQMFPINGSLDRTFAQSGKFISSIGTQCNAITLQPDGKIILAGYYSPSLFHFHIFVIRLTETGQLDPNFGEQGIVRVPYLTGHSVDQANAVTLQSDGKIVVAGFTQDASADNVAHMAVVRLLSTGNLDATFGSTGTFTTSPFPGAVYLNETIAGGTSGTNGSAEEANAVVVLEDGTIVCAGMGVDLSSVNHFVFASFSSLGSLNTNFGGVSEGMESRYQGTCYIHPTIAGGVADQCTALAIQSDGQLLAAGYTTDMNGSNLSHYALVRLSQQGMLDPSFGKTAEGTISSLPGTVYIFPTIAGGTISYGVDFENESCQSLALQNDGKIVLGGCSEDTSSAGLFHFSLARFLDNGTLDQSFGATTDTTTSRIPGTVFITETLAGALNGEVTYSIRNDCINAIAIQNDGSIVAIGYAQNNYATAQYCAAARFTQQGTLDPSFGSNTAGTQSIIPGTCYIYPTLSDEQSDIGYAGALQKNGLLVIGGSTGISHQYFAMVRLFNSATKMSYTKSYTQVGAGINS